MSALNFGLTMLKNFNPGNSVLAGGGASLFIYAIGLALVTGGIALPFIGIPTMAMVGAAAVAGGHIVTALVPDSLNQNLDAAAKKLNVAVEDLKVVVPQAVGLYPGDDSKPIPCINNLNNKPL